MQLNFFEAILLHDLEARDGRTVWLGNKARANQFIQHDFFGLEMMIFDLQYSAMSTIKRSLCVTVDDSTQCLATNILTWYIKTVGPCSPNSRPKSFNIKKWTVHPKIKFGSALFQAEHPPRTTTKVPKLEKHTWWVGYYILLTLWLKSGCTLSYIAMNETYKFDTKTCYRIN